MCGCGREVERARKREVVREREGDLEKEGELLLSCGLCFMLPFIFIFLSLILALLFTVFYFITDHINCFTSHASIRFLLSFLFVLFSYIVYE